MSLPHQFPFRCVDGLLSRSGTGKAARIMARKRVTAGEALASGSAGAFPSYWMAEMIAQTGALGFRTGDGAAGRLVAIDDFAAYGEPAPGDDLDIEVWMEASFGKLARLRGEARRNGDTLATAAFTIYEEAGVATAAGFEEGA